MLEKEGVLAFHQYDGIGSGAIIRLPLETPTAWKVNDSEFASLGSLWCFIEYRNLIPSEIMKKAREIGVQTL